MLGGLSSIAKFPLLCQARIVTSWTGRGTSFCLLTRTRARDKKTLYDTPGFNAVLEVTERSLTVELASFSAKYDKQRPRVLVILTCKGVVLLAAAASVKSICSVPTLSGCK